MKATFGKIKKLPQVWYRFTTHIIWDPKPSDLYRITFRLPVVLCTIQGLESLFGTFSSKLKVHILGIIAVKCLKYARFVSNKGQKNSQFVLWNCH